MKLFGLTVPFTRESTELVRVEKQNDVSALSPLWSWGAGWINVVRESFAGAWQQGISLDTPRGILAFSAVFSCVTGIAADVAKNRLMLQKLVDGGIWEEMVDGSPLIALLRKPNRYLNRIKFIEQWVISKLLHGNTYVLKQRDAKGNVEGLYVLDPWRVKVLIAPDGSVFYQLATDHLSEIPDVVTVPASEIIHDTMVCLWHPLIGVSPIYACGMSATMGNRIQSNQTAFFANASRPSGVLTAPGAISDEVAGRLKAAWEENFSGSKIGRLAVLGDGLEYKAMTITATDAQLIETLKWSVEDVARAFHYPLYKLGGAVPANNTVEALNQAYYSDCLQAIIESLELSLEEGLELNADESIELDLDNLLRMDSAARYEKHNNAVKGGWLAPNEARACENLLPVKGGDSPMMQQQNWSLGQLADRKAPTDSPAVAPPPAGGTPPPPPTTNNIIVPATRSADEEDLAVAELAAEFIAGLGAPVEGEAHV